MPLPAYFRAGVLNIVVGKSYDRDKIINSLLTFGYNRTSLAESAGDFAVRGGIIDIINYDKTGYRIDFFGSKIDSIKTFDTISQLTLQKTAEITIHPISEVIVTDETTRHFKEKYLQLFGINDTLLYLELARGSKYIGAEHWLPLFYKELKSILDYIPKSALIIENDQLETNLNNYCLLINQNYTARENDGSYNAIAPSLLYSKEEEILTALEGFSTYSGGTINFAPNIQLNATINNKKVTHILADYQKAICICCQSECSLSRIERLLNDENISSVRVASYEEILNQKTVIKFAILPIENGFDTEKITFFTEKDITGQAFKEQKKRKATAAKISQDLISIEIGNLLVHAEYGIGRFQGLKTLSVNDIPHDFIEILYADNDKLYLPVENLETISRYGKENQSVALDKLGGVTWKMRKAKLKERIKLAASALINTAAKRLTTQGHVLEPIHENYQKFCDNFPYITTADQESAIEEIMEDFKSGQPMDRLLCADVGFGKTEVALRAAAAATLGLETVQVAVIVPTTLLARQHYITFSERFKNFPLIIKQLSKFTSRTEVSEVKEGLKNGKIDITIGTHALLTEGINFKNLGLLIIDEEQHFGVAQKEKLKNLKDNIHILTLSATPIPRTLQMALVNLKSLSIITTPPINKKPVKTSVLPYDRLTIREALLKEKQRNGLSFYVTPRINYLDEIEEQLKKLVPELKVVKAQGSLVSSKLDQVMNDFYDHKFDILLSTSIIESGLDIMSANTMIVDRAHMFGLSQLYQMRGRVGRGEAQAYAYFLAPRTNLLSPVAKKRLEIIQSLQALGSGFNIASHDMDNRGYGNLLGDEQSGHIREVGIELYQKMLADTIAQMQGNEEFEANKEWSPILNLGVSVQIPEDYIDDVTLRLSLYRQIANIVEEEECERFATEMVDRFGKLPEEVEHLFDIIKIKQLARKANVLKVEAGAKGLIFSFRDNKANSNINILEIITSEREFEAKLKPDGKVLFLLRATATHYEKIKSARRILLKLAGTT